ncbi:MAG: type II toxin-antitoxin system PrlF family antitoxin [Gemmatimonadota bacterium]
MATNFGHPSTKASRLRSKLTTKSQTTLPSGVRKALQVAPGDELEYVIEGDHAVIRKAVQDDADDPVLGAFLNLLAADMTENADRVRGIPRELLARIRSFAGGSRVDHDEPITGPVAL